MGQYKHVAGGKCFECGKTLPATAGASAAPKLDRAAIIRTLAVLIRNAEAARAEGDLEGFFAAVTGPDACPSLDGLLSIADADVRARAEAAIARLRA